MIKSINGLAIGFFKTNKFISFVSIFSVLISVSLIITMAVFSANAKQSIENEVKKMFGNMDLMVGYNLDQNKVVDKRLLTQITSLQNDLQISSVLLTHLRIDRLSSLVYTIGIDNDSLAKSRYHFSSDIAANELILNAGLAQALKVQVSESIQIENRPFVVKEVIPDLDASGATSDFIVLSRFDVKEIMKANSHIENQEATYLLIKAKDNADLPLLIDHIRDIDTELRIDVAQENEFLVSNLSSLRVFITVAMILILIVTSLIIISNYEVVLYKSRNQFAIMRSIGATTHQLFRMVLFQCSIINFVGGVLGYLLAFLSHRFLQVGIEKIYSFPTGAMNFNHMTATIVMLICMIVIEAFMLIPAYNSSKVLPIRIMQENEKTDFSYGKKIPKLGKFMLVGGAIFLVFAVLINGTGPRLLCGLIGIVLLMIGIMRLFPHYLTLTLTSMLPIIKRLFGKIPYIATKNVLPQVKRNTFIILIISFLMIITVFGSAFLKTIEQTNEQYLKKEYSTEIVVKNRVGQGSGIDSSDLRKEISKIPNVVVSTLSNTSQLAIVQGDKFIDLNYTLVDLRQMEKQGLVPPVNDADMKSIIVTEEVSKHYGLAIGDQIVLALYSFTERKWIPVDKVSVAAIMEKIPGNGIFMDWSNNTFVDEYIRFDKAYIQTTDTKQTLVQLEELLSRYPELQISTLEKSLEESQQLFYQRWSIFIALVIVILLSVMFGVFNTLMNNINSKRKEFAILRTLLVTKKGIMQFILTQIMLYILIGCVSGVTIGLLLSYSLNLLEATQVFIDWRFVGIIMIVLFSMAIIVFVPTGMRIGKMNISSELVLDNK
ncbi:FtsX-like permease family protein [Paenibacillus albiflavus]|uniref:FtsX-like permease family protein n=1 Tax=Paenibacillus albiflavus TaxID=2545760 RepID=A0A4R4EIU4_9BACL|nr:FtsX-like permease family protein [Paenibacillus albiflavus]TCZ78271.1 FtsX-like permease family protein [Paenibacillus albiflavus]